MLEIPLCQHLFSIHLKHFFTVLAMPSDHEISHIIIYFVSVGSFIVSYLIKLRASTNPGKEHIKAVYGEVRTNKRFPVDFRKFSHYFEFSYLLDGPNIGSTVESNIIYSQRSFLPRASTLNLTTVLFGRLTNVFEVCKLKIKKTF